MVGLAIREGNRRDNFNRNIWLGYVVVGSALRFFHRKEIYDRFSSLGYEVVGSALRPLIRGINLIKMVGLFK